MAQMALRWILMNEAVTSAIAGAKRPAQVEENVGAADLPPLSDAAMGKISAVYDQYFREEVQALW
jgi:aryl-alcohol dehydrogenase-like predicted oxidoreductase